MARAANPNFSGSFQALQNVGGLLNQYTQREQNKKDVAYRQEQDLLTNQRADELLRLRQNANQRATDEAIQVQADRDAYTTLSKRLGGIPTTRPEQITTTTPVFTEAQGQAAKQLDVGFTDLGTSLNKTYEDRIKQLVTQEGIRQSPANQAAIREMELAAPGIPLSEPAQARRKATTQEFDALLKDKKYEGNVTAMRKAYGSNSGALATALDNMAVNKAKIEQKIPVVTPAVSRKDQVLASAQQRAGDEIQAEYLKKEPALLQGIDRYNELTSTPLGTKSVPTGRTKSVDISQAKIKKQMQDEVIKSGVPVAQQNALLKNIELRYPGVDIKEQRAGQEAGALYKINEKRFTPEEKKQIKGTSGITQLNVINNVLASKKGKKSKFDVVNEILQISTGKDRGDIKDAVKFINDNETRLKKLPLTQKQMLVATIRNNYENESGWADFSDYLGGSVFKDALEISQEDLQF